MNQAHEDALLQITEERYLISKAEVLLKVGLATVSKRAETTLARRSAQLAFMWLGKAKQALGTPNPYPSSTDPTSKAIEPSQDVFTDYASLPGFEDEIAFVKHVRQQLGDIEPKVKNDQQILTDHPDFQFAVRNALTNLVDAKMWCGQVLALIREEQNFQPTTAQTPVNKPDKKVLTEDSAAPMILSAAGPAITSSGAFDYASRRMEKPKRLPKEEKKTKKGGSK